VQPQIEYGELLFDVEYSVNAHEAVAALFDYRLGFDSSTVSTCRRGEIRRMWVQYLLLCYNLRYSSYADEPIEFRRSRSSIIMIMMMMH
jgi:hypothetical protein